MNKTYRAICLFGFASALIFTQDIPVSSETRVRVDGNRVRVKSDNVQVNSSSFSLIGGGTNIIIKESSGWRGRYPHDRKIDCPADTMKYAPVCARTHNYLVATYSNRCFAQLDNATVISGEHEPCPAVDCHALYKPVCARINEIKEGQISLERPKILPFINSCVAANYRKNPDEEITSTTILRSYGEPIYVHARPRHPPRRDFDDNDDFSRVCPRDGLCPEHPEFVCAKDHNEKLRIYKNKCYAVLEGAEFKWYIRPHSPACK